MSKAQDSSALIPTEAAEHEAVIIYLAHKYPKARWNHAMNEGKRGWKAQRAVKSHGVSKGYPDLIIYDWRESRVLHLELKRVKGSTTSTEQKEWLQWLKETGHVAVVAKGFEQARAAIDEFFRLSDRRVT